MPEKPLIYISCPFICHHSHSNSLNSTYELGSRVVGGLVTYSDAVKEVIVHFEHIKVSSLRKALDLTFIFKNTMHSQNKFI